MKKTLYSVINNYLLGIHLLSILKDLHFFVFGTIFSIHLDFTPYNGLVQPNSLPLLSILSFLFIKHLAMIIQIFYLVHNLLLHVNYILL